MKSYLFLKFFLRSLLGLSSLSFAAQPQSACKNLLANYEITQSLEGHFDWKVPPKTQYTARAWTLKSSDPQSQADDRRSRAMSLESAKQCVGILKGERDPTGDAIFPSGDLSLEVLKRPNGQDFLMVHSDTFRMSILRETHLVYFRGGDVKSSLVRVWSDFTKSVDPSGEEEVYELSLSESPLTLVLKEKGNTDASEEKKWRWDSANTRFDLQSQ
jgi:hypothetical protein